MVHVVELAVVDLAVGWACVEVGSAQEFGLNCAGPLAGTRAIGHKFLVNVEVSPNVDGDLLVEETSNLKRLVHPGDLASIPTSQTQVFEVVNTLGLDQNNLILSVLVHVSAVVIGQTALEGHVVVLCAPALEISFIETCCQTSLFG